jgi:hypothetical protein
VCLYGLFFDRLMGKPTVFFLRDTSGIQLAQSNKCHYRRETTLTPHTLNLQSPQTLSLSLNTNTFYLPLPLTLTLSNK